jgi:uncharacterized membrane-anchored protein YitT (DUF2179 family)
LPEKAVFFVVRPSCGDSREGFIAIAGEFLYNEIQPIIWEQERCIVASNRRRSWRDEVYRYLMVGVGSVFGGVSINAFLVPHHLLSGGLSGIAMIMHFMIHTPIGLVVALLNIPVLFAAYRLLDRSYFFNALFGMAVFTVSIDTTQALAGMNITDDIFLASIYGGVIGGIGTGLVFRVDGSCGGTDAVAALMKKYYAFNMSYVGFFINCLLMTVAAFLFGFKPAMYTLLSMYVLAAVTDKVIGGFNTKKTVMIISEYADEIAEAIMNELGRGVTFFYGQGAFTKDNKKVVFVVLTLIQTAKIKPVVNELDPAAFMIVQDAVEVLGHGFSLPAKKNIMLNQ